MSAVKMHADEVDTDPALVRRLLAAQFPQWADLPIEPVEPRGTDNALYRVGEAMVARLPRRPGTDVTLEKERAWLPTLAPFLPLAVPLPVAEGAPAAGYPYIWSIYSWLDGNTAVAEPIVDPARAARDLAEFLRALQGIDAAEGPQPGGHNFGRGEALVYRDAAVRASIDALRDQLDAARLTALWEDALRASEWQAPPVWIHGDLDARNLLVQRGRLSGVIDWGCLGVGDPACDVMAGWKLLAPEGRDVFRAALCVDDDTWTRARGWALSQAVGALSYYTPVTNAVLVQEARRWLSEVLAEA